MFAWPGVHVIAEVRPLATIPRCDSGCSCGHSWSSGLSATQWKFGRLAGPFATESLVYLLCQAQEVGEVSGGTRHLRSCIEADMQAMAFLAGQHQPSMTIQHPSVFVLEQQCFISWKFRHPVSPNHQEEQMSSAVVDDVANAPQIVSPSYPDCKK